MTDAGSMASEPIETQNPKAYRRPTIDNSFPCDSCDTNLPYLRAHLVDYDVHSLIRSGGQAEVYHATHRPTAREVAIKLLFDGPVASEQQRQRIIREGHYLGRLNHANIVTIYDAGELGRRNYLVMQYVDGRPIDEYVVLKNLGIQQTLELFVQVCDALSTAHEHGIIHRDVKPGNVLVGTDGIPHVVDFGFARAALDDSAQLSGSMTLVGTLPYLSPERVEKGISDSRSDVYALGITLFETITDAFPFPVEGTREEVIQQIKVAKRLSLRQGIALAGTNEAIGVGAVCDDLEKIVAKAIALDPEERYRTARELQDDLRRCLRGEAVAAKSANALYVLRKTVWRYRAYAVATLVVIAALAGSLAYSVSSWRKTGRVVDQTQVALEMAGLIEYGEAARGSGRVDAAIRDLDAAIRLADGEMANVPVVRERLFSALHRMADLCYSEGKIDEAQSYADRAISIADQPGVGANSIQWESRRAFALLLAGKAAYHNGQYGEAADRFQTAAESFAHLGEYPDIDYDHRRHIAYARAYRGQALEKCGEPAAANEEYIAAIALYEQIVSENPDASDVVVRLANTETDLAAWHLRRKTANDDLAALKLIDKAAGRLDEIHDAAVKRDVQLVHQRLDIDRQIARKRLGC